MSLDPNFGATDPSVEPTPVPGTLADAANADPVIGKKPKAFRVEPADWTVSSVQWVRPASKKGDEDETVLINRPFGGYAGYVVEAADADDLITEAASHGYALTKEPVA